MIKIDNKLMGLFKILKQNNVEAYLVGGCVRDLYLGVKPNDFDICSSATPDELISLLKKLNMNYFESGIQYGTITVIIDNEQYEITTFRKETGYSDKRHPDKIEYTKDIHEDLCRRDFTINAMAYNPLDETLIDDFGGLTDIKNKLIRCVGNAEDRLKEDSLRILRAMRFSLKYQFNIDENTSKAIHTNVKGLNDISKERITSELEKMLTIDKNIRDIFIEFSDVISEIIPEIGKCVNFNQNNKYHKHDVYEHSLAVVDGCKTNDFIIKLAGLLHDIGKPDSYSVDEDGHGHFYGHPEISYKITQDVVKNDLKLTREQSDRLLWLVKYHDMNTVTNVKSIRRLLNKHGVAYINDWFILKESDLLDHINMKDIFIDSFYKMKERTYEQINNKACFDVKDLNINGKILMDELNLKTGKTIGEILKALLEEVINESVVNETNELINKAKEIYERMQ